VVRVVAGGGVKYRTIVADPPWDHSEGTGAKFATGFGKTRRALEGDKPTYTLPYPVMTVEQITALPVLELADRMARSVHLYLWVTNKYVRHVWDVAEAWGFFGVRLIVWCKEPRGWNPGGKWPSTCEFCLFAVRDNLATKEDRPYSSRLLGHHGGQASSQWFVWPRRLGPPVRAGEQRQTMHSAKPEAFLDEVEKVSPGPYLELFARRQRLGWDTWGDEALPHVELTA
jgi:N6-adenosine-specific RNA methylase IME4